MSWGKYLKKLRAFEVCMKNKGINLTHKLPPNLCHSNRVYVGGKEPSKFSKEFLDPNTTCPYGEWEQFHKISCVSSANSYTMNFLNREHTVCDDIVANVVGWCESMEEEQGCYSGRSVMSCWFCICCFLEFVERDSESNKDHQHSCRREHKHYSSWESAKRAAIVEMISPQTLLARLSLVFIHPVL